MLTNRLSAIAVSRRWFALVLLAATLAVGTLLDNRLAAEPEVPAPATPPAQTNSSALPETSGTVPSAPALELELFNGRDLSGWVVTDCRAGVEDGALVLLEGNGLVRSESRYGDFLLTLEWRARNAEKYDSGIYIRAELPPEGKPWPRQYQLNLSQGIEGNVANLPGAVSTGLIKPAGEWNQMAILVRGDRVTTTINGQQAWSVSGLKSPTGYVGFQAEVPSGGQFEFRNIRLTELDHRSLFNGQDFSGWEGATSPASDCWLIDEGLLHCTGKQGPWLRSRETFDDFNLRLDYKLSPGGNSGVYIRVPEDGNHHGTGAGIEFQLLDDAAPKYANLDDYKYSASAYNILGAKPRVSRPAGQWNSLEINCRGTRYTVTHNGTVVVDASGEEVPRLAKRRVAGHLGLQNHDDPVWFRNLRIGPAYE